MTNKNVILIKQGASDAFENKIFHVNWRLTDMCNYGCQYCFGNGPKQLGSEKYSAKLQLLKAVNRIKQIKKDYYTVYLTGGEPTLHPNLEDIVRILSEDDNCKIAVTTNFSKSIEYYNYITSIGNNVFLEPSIHFEYVKQYEKVMANIVALAKQISMINIMAHPYEMDKVKNFCTILSSIAPKYGLNFYVRIIREGDSVSKKYSESDLHWINNLEQTCYSSNNLFNYSNKPIYWYYHNLDNNQYFKKSYDRNELTYHGYDDFKYMFCLSSSIICISSQGIAKQGVCGSYDQSFDIFENDFPEEYFNPVICRSLRCSCTANHFTPKFINTSDAPKFISDKQIIEATQNLLLHKRKHRNCFA